MRRKCFSLALALALHAAAFALAAAFLRAPPAVAPRVSFDVEGRAMPRGAAVSPAPTAAAAPATRSAPPTPTRSRSASTSTMAPLGVASPPGEPAPSQAAGSAPQPGGAEPPVPSAPGPSSVDPEAIRAAIQAHVQYPRLARAQGLEGTVVVRFRLGPGGSPEHLTVVTSGGDLLDDAARRAVEKAAPFPPGAGWVRVPIDFALRPPP